MEHGIETLENVSYMDLPISDLNLQPSSNQSNVRLLTQNPLRLDGTNKITIEVDKILDPNNSKDRRFTSLSDKQNTNYFPCIY